MRIRKFSKLFSVVIVLFVGLLPLFFAGSSVYAFEQSSNLLSEVQAIEENYVPEIIESEAGVTESYVVSSADLARLESLYLPNSVSLRAWGSDIPKRTTITSGSFKVSSVVGLAGAIAGKFGAGSFLDTLGMNSNVYYYYTHTSWRTNGILYVEGKMSFFRDSARQKYITSTYHNRQYSDNMLD